MTALRLRTLLDIILKGCLLQGSCKVGQIAHSLLCLVQHVDEHILVVPSDLRNGLLEVLRDPVDDNAILRRPIRHGDNISRFFLFLECTCVLMCCAAQWEGAVVARFQVRKACIIESVCHGFDEAAGLAQSPGPNTWGEREIEQFVTETAQSVTCAVNECLE